MQCAWEEKNADGIVEFYQVSIPYRVHAITDLTRVCLLFRPSIADFFGFFKVFSVRPLFRKWLDGGLLKALKNNKNLRTVFGSKSTDFGGYFPFDPLIQQPSFDTALSFILFPASLSERR